VDIGDALFWSKWILADRVHPPLLFIYAACANAALPAARTPAGKTVADYQKYKRMFQRIRILCAEALGLQASSLSHLFDTLVLKIGEKTVEWIVENGCILQCRDNDENAKCTRMGLIKKN